MAPKNRQGADRWGIAGQAPDALTDRNKFEPTGLVDPIWAFLFILHVVAVGCWVAYAASTGLMSQSVATLSADSAAELLQGNFAKAKADPVTASVCLISLSLVLAVVYACVWMYLLQTYPKQMVYASMWGMVVLQVVIAIALLMVGAILGCVMSFIVAAVCVCIFFCFKRQLEFTARIVEGVSTVYSGHRSIFGMAFVVVFLQMCWVALAVVAMLPTFAASAEEQRVAQEAQDKGEDPPPGQGGPGMIEVVQVFSFFWGSQVFSNILHVACAGVIARYYFNKQIDNAVSKSTGQAFTSYLGPIALGSFLIAVIQTLKYIAEQFRRDGQQRGSAVEQIIACVAVCVLGCLERLMEIFNVFCFVITAIYGTSFCTSGQEVIRLFKSRNGFQALYAWNFAGIVCFIGNLAGALIVTCIIALLAFSMQLHQGYMAICCVCAFCMSFVIMMVVGRVVESGCDTLIVCYVEEPEKAETASPELYEAFRERKRISDQD